MTTPALCSNCCPSFRFSTARTTCRPKVTSRPRVAPKRHAQGSKSLGWTQKSRGNVARGHVEVTWERCEGSRGMGTCAGLQYKKARAHLLLGAVEDGAVLDDVNRNRNHHHRCDRVRNRNLPHTVPQYRVRSSIRYRVRSSTHLLSTVWPVQHRARTHNVSTSFSALFLAWTRVGRCSQVVLRGT
eukprot:1555153-Rhodomonas_salina.2